jgi:hypothetical protein
MSNLKIIIPDNILNSIELRLYILSFLLFPKKKDIFIEEGKLKPEYFNWDAFSDYLSDSSYFDDSYKGTLKEVDIVHKKLPEIDYDLEVYLSILNSISYFKRDSDTDEVQFNIFFPSGSKNKIEQILKTTHFHSGYLEHNYSGFKYI